MALFPGYDDGKYVNSGASLSPDGKYRFHLWREWRGVAPDKNWFWYDAEDGEPLGEPKSCIFIMLNPSTADGTQDDPTIRKCVAFAKALGYDRLDILNLFAYRTPHPQVLLKLNHNADPVGVRNQEYFQKVIDEDTTGVLICAWGVHGDHLGQASTTLGWLPYNQELHCLGMTKHGHPRHPLYLPASAELIRYFHTT